MIIPMFQMRKKCACGNFIVCECGGCAHCCPHEENPKAMQEAMMMYPTHLTALLGVNFFPRLPHITTPHLAKHYHPGLDSRDCELSCSD